MHWQLNSQSYVTTDPQQLDREVVFNYLHDIAYWSKGIPREICMTSLDHSIPFSVIHQQQQIGFGRLVTDECTFAYLGDVFVLDAYQGHGFGTFLVSCINDWLDQHRIRTALLLTSDAQSLYAAQGWVHPSDVRRFMRYKEPVADFYGSFSSEE